MIKIKIPLNAVLGMGTEVLYALVILSTGFLICLIVSLW